MDPKTLKEVMGQGATRPETPQERREREQLEADLATSPVRGMPLRQRLRNFRPDPDSGVRALGGPTAWMRRLRAIEDAVEQHERRLGENWRLLAEELEDPEAFAAAWHELADSWSFAQVNELIERHNRNFPAEARLAMDPRTRDFVRVNGRSYLRELLDAQWILDRFPADREAALL
jgi:glutathione S-transferase